MVVFGAKLVGEAIRNWVIWGNGLPDAKFIYLGDGANSRGTADMEVLPDRLPGYEADREKWEALWKAEIPQAPNFNLRLMLKSAEEGTLPMLYLVDADPVGEGLVEERALRRSSLLAQDIYLKPTALFCHTSRCRAVDVQASHIADGRSYAGR